MKTGYLDKPGGILLTSFMRSKNHAVGSDSNRIYLPALLKSGYLWSTQWCWPATWDFENTQTYLRLYCLHMTGRITRTRCSIIYRGYKDNWPSAFLLTLPTIFYIGPATWDFQQCGMCDRKGSDQPVHTQSDQSLCYSLLNILYRA